MLAIVLLIAIWSATGLGIPIGGGATCLAISISGFTTSLGRSDGGTPKSRKRILMRSMVGPTGSGARLTSHPLTAMRCRDAATATERCRNLRYWNRSGWACPTTGRLVANSGLMGNHFMGSPPYHQPRPLDSSHEGKGHTALGLPHAFINQDASIGQSATIPVSELPHSPVLEGGCGVGDERCDAGL